MSTTSTVQRLAERRDELIGNPRSFPDFLIQRAILADEVERERGASRDFSAIELEDCDRAFRTAYPGAGDPAFRALFVHGQNDRRRSAEFMPPAELRALGSSDRTETTDRTFSETLFASLVAQSPVLGLATLVRTSNGAPHSLSYVATDSSANGIVDDGSSITVGDAVFGRAQFSAYSYKDRLVLSEELFFDGAFNATDYAARALASGPTIRAFGVHCMTGDGSSQPLGLANSGTLSSTTAASATVLALDDIAAALQALPAAAAHSGDCAIILSHDAWGDIIRATEGTSAAGGRSLNAAGYQGRLWGIPVYVDPALAATATTNIVAVIGDLRSAYAVRICPVRVDVDHHATLATGQVAVRAVIRGDATTMVTANARTITMA